MADPKNLNKLREKQKSIARKIVTEDEFPKPIKIIAGFDVAYSEKSAFASGIILDYKSLCILEIKCLEMKNKDLFPYIPTFLGFREGPIIAEVYKKLSEKPDIIMINGHGIAHPLFCGSASHIGFLLNKPTIGIAQNKLVGTFKEPKKLGKAEKLYFEKKQIGWVLKTKKISRPIFISPGHRISLQSSLEITKHCIKDHKLPEPLRLAHEYATKMRIY